MPFTNRIFILFISLLSLGACREPVHDDAEDRRIDSVAEGLYLDGHRQEAVKYLDSIYAHKSVSTLGRYLIYSRKEQYYYELPDLALSMLYDDSAIGVIRNSKTERKYVKEYTHALLEKGHIYSKAGQYDSAYKSYLDGYQFVMVTGNQCVMHEFDYFIGMALFRQNERKKARDFFIRSFNEISACDDKEKPWYRMQELLDNIALSLTADSGSIFYFDSCLSFIYHNAGKFHNEEMVANALSTCYKNKGVSLLSIYRLKEAKECMYKAIDVYSQLDSNKYKDIILDRKLELASTFYYADDTQDLVRLWRELKPAAEISKSEHVKRLWLQATFMYYDVTHDYENAYHSYIAFNNFTNEVKYDSGNVSKKDITQDIRNMEQDYKIQLLIKERQLQRLYLCVVIGLSCIAVFIIIMVYRNYKKTRENNELISRQKSALEASNREKDRILNVVAHDLRNPIGSISFLSDTMLMDDDPMLTSDEAFQLIKTSSDGALHLVDELLSVEKDDQRPLKKVDTDINELVKQCLASLKYKADKKKQNLVSKLPDGPVVLGIDKNKMERVLSNLVTNAIKFSKEGGDIELAVQKTNTHVVIEVRDNGIGIPEKMIPGLFDIFSDARRRGTAGEQSYGLGLSICKKIVQDHGGTLTVTSTEGKGSVFIITLPVS